MANEPTTTTTATTEPAKTDPPKAQEPPKGDEPLGEGGKKALEAERDARKKAEAELATLRTDFDGFKTELSKAFGLQQPATGDGADAVSQLQTQLNTMQHETAVYRLAAKHEITDEGDLELLKSATDEAAMTKLAERLAAAKTATPGTPKPDATQGGGSGTAPALNSDGLEQALKSKLGIT